MTHSKDKVVVAAYQAYSQNKLHQTQERQLLRHHDGQETTYEDTSGQDDDARYGETNQQQQHDMDGSLQMRMEDEGNPVRKLHYGVGQLQSPSRCDPAHDTRYGQK